MNAYLIGSGVGVIGLLGGVAYGFFMRVRYERMLGKLRELQLTHKQELESHARTLQAAVADAEKYERAVSNAEEIAAQYKIRLEKLRDREIEAATFDELLYIANDQPRLRVAPSEAEADNPDSDST